MLDNTRTETVKQRIEDLDLGPIRYKLVHEEGLALETVLEQEKWYKRFLLLTYKYPDRPIVVSRDIDEFWHQHILDTRKYAADCDRVFGAFLHHFPYFGLRGEDDAQALSESYQESLALMRAEFGEAPRRENAERAASCSDCSGMVEAGASCSDCSGMVEAGASCSDCSGMVEAGASCSDCTPQRLSPLAELFSERPSL